MILDLLGGRAAAIFVREPLVDPWFPATSDADVLAFSAVDSLQPERLNLPAASGGLPIDVIWLPQALLRDGAALARQGLLAHRLATSRLLADSTGSAARDQQVVVKVLYEPQVQGARIDGFLELGYLAVREIGVTWDFPAMALFWLHAAFAATVAALGDTARLLCPNVYTRPFDGLRTLSPGDDQAWRSRSMRALLLDRDPESQAAPLILLHDIVTRRFPEPAWPAAMRSTTRKEYAYFGSVDELQWRLAVAREMAERGERAQAVYYLRFWAYCLARIPMVWQCAREGRDVSFMRPERAVGPALRALCPEILEPLNRLLGDGDANTDDVRAALPVVTGFRDEVIALAGNQGIPIDNRKPWAPFG